MITEVPVAETPSEALPVSDLGFGRYFADRMFSQRFMRGRGWHDATIGPYAPITLDPAAQVLHNGQMIFDGTKAYRRPDGQINLFRPERNAERFNRSAARMGMPEVPVAEHVAAIEALVALESRWVPSAPQTALYIRPVMIATEKALAIRAPAEFLHYIILSPVAPYFAGGFAPVAVYVAEQWVRAVRGGTGEAKTPGNYAGSIVATEEAIARGYAQVLWLDALERRYVDEVGAMNIAFVYADGTLRTPALSGAILHGVTRESVLVLARDAGLKVEETRIDFQEVCADLVWAPGRLSHRWGGWAIRAGTSRWATVHRAPWRANFTKPLRASSSVCCQTPMAGPARSRRAADRLRAGGGCRLRADAALFAQPGCTRTPFTRLAGTPAKKTNQTSFGGHEWLTQSSSTRRSRYRARRSLPLSWISAALANYCRMPSSRARCRAAGSARCAPSS
jgi:branched-chain amino acid aminotransferase